MTAIAQKIYDVFQSTLKFTGDRHLGELGIEIETERDKEYEYPRSKFWRCTRDGSLRKFGVEYILKSPVNLDEARQALDEFESFDNKYKFDKDSVSTSVHVHVNMLNDTFKTMANFMVIYALSEPLLIRYSGPDRLSNLFCLPFRDAEGTLPYYTQMLSYIARNAFNRVKINEEAVKYSALNCASLTKLGTLEIRTFRGETDIKVIHRWLSIIMKMKEFARQEDLDPYKILDLWREKKIGFFEEVFGEYTNELKGKLSDKEIETLILEKNQYYAAKFATTCRDWSKFGVLKIKPVYRLQLKDELDYISLDLFKQSYETLGYASKLVVDEHYIRNNANVRIIEQEGDI